MTSAEYKGIYGKESMTSPEYRNKRSASTRGENNPNYNNTWSEEQKKKLSEKNKGRQAWNKGKTIQDYTQFQSESLINGIQKREQRYKNGELHRHSTFLSDDAKQKISESVKTYAEHNQDEVKQRAQKAVVTKRHNGYDFGANMRGKKHSDETKTKISKSSSMYAELKKKQSHERLMALLAESDLNFISRHDNVVTVECSKCGCNFQRTKQYFTPSKFSDDMCPSCFPRDTLISAAEVELNEYIRSIYDGVVISSDRQALGNKEIDIFLPELNIGIEFNGLYWHSEIQLISNGYSPKKDFEKYKLATSNGIRLIQIFEDEWKYKPNIVKSMLASILNKSQNRIYARKTEIKEISASEANAFVKDNHIQGSGRSNVRYGLYHDGTLVSVMTFSKSNLSRKVNTWEVDRFCSVLGTNVVGGASKLFSKFLKEHKPDTVISYSDNRWNTGKVYEHIGMIKDKQTTPGYWYFYRGQCERIHRFTLRKNSNDEPQLTEWENRVKQGYNRVWDCGHTLWCYRT